MEFDELVLACIRTGASREDAEAAFDALDEKDKRATVLGPDFFKGGPKKD